MIHFFKYYFNTFTFLKRPTKADFSIFLSFKEIFSRLFITYYVILFLLFVLFLIYICFVILPTVRSVHAPSVSGFEDSSLFFGLFSFSAISWHFLFFVVCLFINVVIFILVKNGYVLKSISSSFLFILILKFLFGLIKKYHTTRMAYDDNFCHFFGFDFNHVYALSEKLSYASQFCASQGLNIDTSVLSILSSKASSVSELSLLIIEHSQLSVFNIIYANGVLGFLNSFTMLSHFCTAYSAHWIGYSSFIAFSVGSFFFYRWWNNPSVLVVDAVRQPIDLQGIAVTELTPNSLAKKVIELEEVVKVYKLLFTYLSKSVYILSIAISELSPFAFDAQPVSKLSQKYLDVVFDACTGEGDLNLVDIKKEAKSSNAGAYIHYVSVSLPGSDPKSGSPTDTSTSDTINSS